MACCIDSGENHTQRVYDFAKARPSAAGCGRLRVRRRGAARARRCGLRKRPTEQDEIDVPARDHPA